MTNRICDLSRGINVIIATYSDYTNYRLTWMKCNYVSGLVSIQDLDLLDSTNELESLPLLLLFEGYGIGVARETADDLLLQGKHVSEYLWSFTATGQIIYIRRKQLVEVLEQAERVHPSTVILNCLPDSGLTPQEKITYPVVSLYRNLIPSCNIFYRSHHVSLLSQILDEAIPQSMAYA